MPRDDTRKQSRPEQPKWRDLAPVLDHMTAEKAIVLALHHLELAHAMFGCIEREPPPDRDIDVDNPDDWEADNAVRLRYALAGLEKRYGRGTSAFKAAARAFFETATAIDDKESREWIERTPVVEIEGPPTPGRGKGD